jgi:hypothetical protein
MKDIQLQNEVARILQALNEHVSKTSIISFEGGYL